MNNYIAAMFCIRKKDSKTIIVVKQINMIESQHLIIEPLIRVNYSDIKSTNLHGIEFNIEAGPLSTEQAVTVVGTREWERQNAVIVANIY